MVVFVRNRKAPLTAPATAIEAPANDIVVSLSLTSSSQKGEALEDAITADVVNEGAIRARSADVAAVEADVAVAQARIRSEILQILTADQQAQLKQFQTQMKERREQMQQLRSGAQR